MKDISLETPFTMKSPDCCIQNSSIKFNIFFTIWPTVNFFFALTPHTRGVFLVFLLNTDEYMTLSLPKSSITQGLQIV